MKENILVFESDKGIIYWIELSTAENTDMAELYMRYIDDIAKDRKISVAYHKMPCSRANHAQLQQNLINAGKWFYQVLGKRKIRRDMK